VIPFEYVVPDLLIIVSKKSAHVSDWIVPELGDIKRALGTCPESDGDVIICMI